jgi:hypothetical protein
MKHFVENWYILVFIVVIVIILIVLIWRIHDKKVRITVGIIPILLVALGFLVDTLLTTNANPDYIQLNKPYLDTKLIVEKTDKEGFYYYYLVKNVGQLPAEKISFTYMSPFSKGSEVEALSKRILAPNGGEMKYTPHPIKTLFKSLKPFNSFVLIISFEAKIKDEVKYFVSTYKNIIPIDVRDGTYTYDECTIEEKKLDSEEKLGLIEYEKIEENLVRFPGVSFNFFLRLASNNEKREKYIWDIGSENDKKRLSMFLDESNYMVFRIISDSGEAKSVKFDANPIINKGEYLNFEVGRKSKSSFIRLGVNGQWLASEKIDFDTQFVEDTLFFKWSMLGADIFCKNGGIFFVTDIFIYKATLTISQFIQNKNYLADKYKNPSEGSVYFDGNDCMHIKDPNNPLRR